jgi:hypothetical protein
MCVTFRPGMRTVLLTTTYERGKAVNLYPPDETVNGPLAPADWTMAVGLEGQGDGAFYFADI